MLNPVIFRLLSGVGFLEVLLYVFAQNQIDVLTEVSVVCFRKIPDFPDYVFVQCDTYFGFIRLLCIHNPTIKKRCARYNNVR